MKYADIFFDFDDTLYDTRGNAQRSLEETFDAYDLHNYFSDPDIFYTEYWDVNQQLWKRYNNNEITKDFLVIERFKLPLLLGKNLSVTDDYCKKMSDTFLEFCSNKPGLLPGALELVSYLKGKGYKLHICSNGFHEVQYKKLAACGLQDYFDTVILSEDAGYNKPSEKFFDYALLTTKAKKENTLMVGDNYVADVCGALNYGIDACLYQRWDKEFAPDREVTFIVDMLTELKDIL